MGVMPNVNFVHHDVIERMNYYITHAKVKMLADLTAEILTDDRADARETKEILAEDVAKLQTVQSLVEELLNIANGTICDNMAQELKEIAEEQKRREEEQKAIEAERKAEDAKNNVKACCVIKPESVTAK